MWNYLRHSLRIRRIEYRIAELPLFAIPILLTVNDSQQLFGVIFWEGLIVFLFLFAFGDLLNCLADCELDRTHKPQLSESVDYLGARGVIVQAILSAIGALAFTCHIAWLTGRWLLVPMVLVGLVLAWSYSVEPVRLKKRGLWQLLFYWLGLFVAPMIFAACLFVDFPSTEVLLVAGAFATVQTGVLLVNTAEDYPEDMEMNVCTVVVYLGIRRGIQLGAFLALVGAVVLFSAFFTLDVAKGGWRAALLWHLPLTAALLYCVATIGRLAVVVSKPKVSEVVAVQRVKEAATRVPIWMSTIAIGSAVSAIALFLA